MTLSGERRAALLSLADQYGFVVVSDNPYAQLRFAGADVPDLDVDSGLVVRAGTFSKTLGPGLRLGWAVLPDWLRGPAVRARLAADQHAGLLTQRVVEHVLATPGQYEDVVARARTAYAERSTALVDALVDRLGDRIEAPAPQGGLFVWARVPDVDLAAVLDVARARGLDFTLGSSFDPTGSGAHTDRARFAYSNATREQLVTAADLFAGAVRTVAGV